MAHTSVAVPRASIHAGSAHNSTVASVQEGTTRSSAQVRYLNLSLWPILSLVMMRFSSPAAISMSGPVNCFHRAGALAQDGRNIGRQIAVMQSRLRYIVP